MSFFSYLPGHGRRLAAILALVLIGALPVAAQSTDDGSIYSRFGLGERETFASSQAQALGGGGTALWSYNYTSFSNPATWSRSVLTRAALGFRVNGLTATDASNQTEKLTNGAFNAAQFSFPLLTDRLGVAFSFEPFSRVNYRVQTSGQLITDPAVQDTSAFLINNEGTGGLQMIRGGAGYRLTNTLSVGASVDLLFGIIEEAQRTTFLESGFAETNVATSTRSVGLTGTLGALFTTTNLLRDRDDLSVAASLTFPASLETDRALTLGESLSRDTLGTLIEGSMELPLIARLGVAYQTDDRWAFVADARYEPWSSFHSTLAVPGFTPSGTSTFQDRLRLSGGAEVVPAGDDLLAPFFHRVAYRLGFYYDQAYVTPIEGVDIHTMAVTAGFGLPTLFTGTRLDINVEAGRRGTTDHQLVRDVFYGVSVTLSVGERWFVKRKLR